MQTMSLHSGKIFLLILCSLCVFTISQDLSNVLAAENNFESDYTFIITVDMRQYAMKIYHSPEHFLGVLQAVDRVGKGEFMISSGDVDPPHAVRNLISKILGEDYPWYPVVGNHEAETESDMEWLVKYNENGTTLPKIVRKGPPGTEETTYSFDWGQCHFIALNQYYDGTSMVGADGNIVPELMEWLEEDLAATSKKFIFVMGHEPMIAMPDMDNGRIRHQGDSLDKYPKNLHQFHQLLLKYGVTAYVCGHTHGTSYSMINGVWQLDAGHSRGIEEDSAPKLLFNMLVQEVGRDLDSGLTEQQAVQKYYNANTKQVKKTLFRSKLVTGVPEYKKIDDQQGLEAFRQFYHEFKTSGAGRDQIVDTFWENSQYCKSTFFKLYVGSEQIKVEIYRDDARGGEYTLRETLFLDAKR